MSRSSLRLSSVLAASLLASRAAAATNNPLDQSNLDEIVTTAREPVMSDFQLEVYRNGEATDLIVAFHQAPNGQFILSAADLRQLGLVGPPGDGPVLLDSLKGVTYRYDDLRQQMFIQAAPYALRTTVISMRPPTPQGPISHDFGMLLNYSLAFDAGQRAVGAPISYESTSGTFEARAFGAFGVVSSSFILGQGPLAARDLRLDSSWTWSDPKTLVSAVAGDLISGGFSWTRPIRIGGIQIRRDFGVRPDMITTPTPVLSASAAAPSTLDVMLGNQVILSRAVPEGPLQISDLPVIQGQGQAKLVLRDSLGAVQQVTAAYFATPDLLRPGLLDFSFEAGYARRNFGLLSDDYSSRLVGEGSVRYGVNDVLTVQAHGEGGAGLGNVGAGVVARVGALGAASFAGSASQFQGRDGGLFAAAFQSRVSVLTLSAQVQETVGDYQDLAAVTLNQHWTFQGQYLGEAPKSLVQIALMTPLAFARFDRSEAPPSFGLSYSQVREVGQPQLSTLNASIEYRIAHHIDVQAAYFIRHSADENKYDQGFFLSVNIPFGRNKDVSAGVDQSGGVTDTFVEARQQERPDVGSTAWSVRADQAASTDLEADGVYRAGFGRLSGRAVLQDNLGAFEGRIDGAVVWLGRFMAAPDRIDQAFAVADVGAPKVPVRDQDRQIGLSDRDGWFLIPNLLPYQATKIDIDVVDLSLDLSTRQTEAMVTPPYGAGALVRFGVTPAPVQGRVTIKLADGGYPSPGSVASLNGGPAELIVGYDGQLYVENLKALNIIMVDLGDGRTCSAPLPIDLTSKTRLHEAQILCRPDPQKPHSLVGGLYDGPHPGGPP